MPIDYKRYPADWKDIRHAIIERSGNRCEWCGVPNHALIQRHGDLWHELSPMEAEVASLCDGERVTMVVLTIAHLGTDHEDGRVGNKHDKMDVRPENLAALCQRCHLMYDLDDHKRHAAETRRQRKMAAGQIVMEV